jgi:three-Cys-motif partner protein
MPQPTHSDFFREMHDWSDRKLRLLTDYVDVAAKILGSINKIYYIDGFAGRGMYGDGAQGSPLRIAELALRFQDEGKPYSFQCINVEENDENFDNLAKQTTKYGSIVRNFHGRFANHLDTILHIIGSQPAIFFLDPFGLKGIEWSAIKKIITRPAPSDLWIRFDHTDVRRLDGNFEVNEQKFQILAEVFGITDRTRLHTLLDAGATPAERIERCLELYQTRLQQAFQQAKGSGYADAYTIRSLEEEYKYHLMFATAHEKGIILASNIVYSVEETYQREIQEYREATEVAKQLSLFAEIEPEPTPEEILVEKV